MRLNKSLFRNLKFEIRNTEEKFFFSILLIIFLERVFFQTNALLRGIVMQNSQVVEQIWRWLEPEREPDVGEVEVESARVPEPLPAPKRKNTVQNESGKTEPPTSPRGIPRTCNLTFYFLGIWSSVLFYHTESEPTFLK